MNCINLFYVLPKSFNKLILLCVAKMHIKCFFCNDFPVDVDTCMSSMKRTVTLSGKIPATLLPRGNCTVLRESKLYLTTWWQTRSVTQAAPLEVEHQAMENRAVIKILKHWRTQESSRIIRLCCVPAQPKVFFWGPIAAVPSSRQWPHYWHEGWGSSGELERIGESENS